MIGRFSRMSLLWKILLSTSVAITLLFGVTVVIVQNHAIAIASATLEQEVQSSFQAYESLWRSRAELLSSVSLLLSTMSDVRRAFGTRDPATIRDTAGELWARIFEENAIFLVTDPEGQVVASLGGAPGAALERSIEAVQAARSRFPKQASGFLVWEGRLYQIVVTPVYVQSADGAALLNVLVAGFVVDALAAQRLKEATGGSDFLFFSGSRVLASTLNPRATEAVAAQVRGGRDLKRVNDGVIEYAPLSRALVDIRGQPVAGLAILRSFESARQTIATLRRNIVLMWLLAVSIGLALTYLLARRIVQPVNELDRAAAQVAQQNYGYRVEVASEDELGRLARTFNSMCESVQKARQELIRQERISTIGRLSSSIVHDLRNPLAAIYGGAEMLVDVDLPLPQVKRLAANIYRASRLIQHLLQELLDVSRGKSGGSELCRLKEVAVAAVDELNAAAESQGVAVTVDIPDELELPLERARMERVFQNLIANAFEAIKGEGAISVSARSQDGMALVEIEDTGPGIAEEIRATLFQPFVTAGKKNGIGLGLALARQTVIDHGGEMWVSSEPGKGARFCFRLPLAATSAPAGRLPRRQAAGAR